MVSSNVPGVGHATLRVLVAHREERLFSLEHGDVSVGRDEQNEVCIDSRVVSAFQARLVREGPTYRFIQLGSTNPTLLRGVPVDDYVLQHGDCLLIAPGTEEEVQLIFELGAVVLGASLEATRAFKTAEAGVQARVERLDLPARGSISIGRSPENAIVLPSLSVSRAHAKLDVANGTVVLSDLGSANGTYVNGAYCAERALEPGDIVRIGPYKLVYKDGAIEHYDDSRAVRLDVHDITRIISGKTILDRVGFSVRPGELVAIAGTSGAGKSTLLDALIGLRPATSGRVIINGTDLYRARDALRPLIGYVPQATILPTQLTVRRALHYVARLRLPPDVSGQDAEQRVDEVMRELNIHHRRDLEIGRLSGGEQKRASIAAELISRPGLFFLDEPTSGLDPGLTRRVTAITRDLARAGSTVIVISHDVESLWEADMLVFLASGGRVVFAGTPTDALEFFGVSDLAEIYPTVEADDPAAWHEKFKASRFHRGALASEGSPAQEEAAPTGWDPFGLITASTRQGISAWRQFRIVAARYVETMVRDRRTLVLLLAQAPVIALFLTIVAKPVDFQPPPAAAVAQAAAFDIPAATLAAALPFMLAATATWFGAINAAREIVKELPIFLRERLGGLRVAPYLASKLLVLAVLCLLQTSVMLGIIWLKVALPSSGALMPAPLEIWISLNLAALTALGLGLVISASVPNADRANSLVPMVLLPQFIFIGGPGTGTVGQWLSYVTVTHWSLEAMKISAKIPYQAHVGGFGGTDLLLRWLALAVMAGAFYSLAALLVSRKGGG
jgi:ABC-type multidrug transport system ATPase subunit/pSer/pThr/pTyr-binding forkhead associated (FHA) protein